MADAPDGSVNAADREFGRRYSAVVVADDRVTSMAALQGLAGSRFGRTRKLSADAGVEAFRVELIDSAFRYSTLPRPDGELFEHVGYVAFFGTSLGRLTLLVSPFSRLLHRVVRDITGRLDPPVEGFLRTDVPALVRGVRQHDIALNPVSSITLRVQGDDGVDLVSLAGRLPIDSTMFETLEATRVRVGKEQLPLARPYRVRVELRHNIGDKPPLRLNLDRHGNMFWYQAGSPTVGEVCLFLQQLCALDGIVDIDPRVPMDQNRASEFD